MSLELNGRFCTLDSLLSPSQGVSRMFIDFHGDSSFLLVFLEKIFIQRKNTIDPAILPSPVLNISTQNSRIDWRHYAVVSSIASLTIEKRRKKESSKRSGESIEDIPAQGMGQVDSLILEQSLTDRNDERIVLLFIMRLWSGARAGRERKEKGETWWWWWTARGRNAPTACMKDKATSSASTTTHALHAKMCRCNNNSNCSSSELLSSFFY